MPKNSLLKLSRQVHLYFGLLISPALLFFAFTGCYQTLGLHEPSANYKPSPLLASLAQIHKKQTYIIPVRRGAGNPEGPRPQAPGASNPDASTRPARAPHADLPPGQPLAKDPDSAGSRPAPSRPAANATGQQAPTLQSKQKQHLPLKIFFVLVSLGLLTSTLTGIYMAYKYDRNKLLVTAVLLAGVVIPLVLLRF